MTKQLFVGDTRPHLILEVRDEDGDAIDFSSGGSNPYDSATAHVRFKDEGTDHFTRAMTLYTDGSDGKFKLVWQIDDFDGTKLGYIDIWAKIIFNSNVDFLTTYKVTWNLIAQNDNPQPEI